MEEDKVSKKDFVREKIKDIPLNRRQALIRIGLSALSGVVFALAALLVLVLCGPMLQPILRGQDEDSGSELQNVVLSETTEIEELKSTETEQQVGSVDDDTEQIVETEKEEVSALENYQKLQNELYAIGEQANRSIVTITSVTSDKDWFNNSYETEGQGSGVIYQKKSGEYRILTEREGIADADRISVTFVNGATVEASLKMYDGSTGLAVLAVDASRMDASTKLAVTVAAFGDADKVESGAITIALGSPLGTSCSILTGSITSTGNEISLADSNYEIITTDMVSGYHGSGILINVEGEVIGFVMQEDLVSSLQNTLTAVSISSLQPVIERLSKGKKIPYLGLCISTVTDEIVRKYDLPKGVYIKSVQVGSPAMEGGLQSGDVITAVNETPTMTAEEYRDAVLSLKPEGICTVTVKRQNGTDYKEITFEIQTSVLE